MIYVTGDMHGDIERFQKRELKRLKKTDTLIVLGDFGFVWDGGEQEKKNFEYISSRKYSVLFIDGTHENFDLLEKYPVIDFCGGRARDLGGNLKQLLRGEIYDIDGSSIFTFGGGKSDDIEFRVEGVSWWPCEMPKAEEIEAAQEKLKAHLVDFILTHEAPQKLAVSLTGEEDESNLLGKFFDRVMLSSKYKGWYFGCYHTDRKITRTHWAVYRNVIEITHPEKKSFWKKLFGGKNKR